LADLNLILEIRQHNSPLHKIFSGNRLILFL
jgi:hypothetical protein